MVTGHAPELVVVPIVVPIGQGIPLYRAGFGKEEGLLRMLGGYEGLLYGQCTSLWQFRFKRNLMIGSRESLCPRTTSLTRVRSDQVLARDGR